MRLNITFWCTVLSCVLFTTRQKISSMAVIQRNSTKNSTIEMDYSRIIESHTQSTKMKESPRAVHGTSLDKYVYTVPVKDGSPNTNHTQLSTLASVQDSSMESTTDYEKSTLARDSTLPTTEQDLLITEMSNKNTSEGLSTSVDPPFSIRTSISAKEVLKASKDEILMSLKKSTSGESIITEIKPSININSPSTLITTTINPEGFTANRATRTTVNQSKQPTVSPTFSQSLETPVQISEYTETSSEHKPHETPTIDATEIHSTSNVIPTSTSGISPESSVKQSTIGSITKAGNSLPTDIRFSTVRLDLTSSPIMSNKVSLSLTKNLDIADKSSTSVENNSIKSTNQAISIDTVESATNQIEETTSSPLSLSSSGEVIGPTALILSRTGSESNYTPSNTEESFITQVKKTISSLVTHPTSGEAIDDTTTGSTSTSTNTVATSTTHLEENTSFHLTLSSTGTGVVIGETRTVFPTTESTFALVNTEESTINQIEETTSSTLTLSSTTGVNGGIAIMLSTTKPTVTIVNTAESSTNQMEETSSSSMHSSDAIGERTTVITTTESTFTSDNPEESSTNQMKLSKSSPLSHFGEVIGETTVILSTINSESNNTPSNTEESFTNQVKKTTSSHLIHPSSGEVIDETTTEFAITSGNTTESSTKQVELSTSSPLTDSGEVIDETTIMMSTTATTTTSRKTDESSANQIEETTPSPLTHMSSDEVIGETASMLRSTDSESKNPPSNTEESFTNQVKENTSSLLTHPSSGEAIDETTTESTITLGNTVESSTNRIEETASFHLTHLSTDVVKGETTTMFPTTESTFTLPSTEESSTNQMEETTSSTLTLSSTTGVNGGIAIMLSTTKPTVTIVNTAESSTNQMEETSSSSMHSSDAIGERTTMITTTESTFTSDNPEESSTNQMKLSKSSPLSHFGEVIGETTVILSTINSESNNTPSNTEESFTNQVKETTFSRLMHSSSGEVIDETTTEFAITSGNTTESSTRQVELSTSSPLTDSGEVIDETTIMMSTTAPTTTSENTGESSTIQIEETTYSTFTHSSSDEVIGETTLILSRTDSESNKTPSNTEESFTNQVKETTPSLSTHPSTGEAIDETTTESAIISGNIAESSTNQIEETTFSPLTDFATGEVKGETTAMFPTTEFTITSQNTKESLTNQMENTTSSPLTEPSTTRVSASPEISVTIQTSHSVSVTLGKPGTPNTGSAHFEFAILLWISGTFNANLQKSDKFQNETVTLVKNHLLPSQYQNIFQLHVAMITEGSIKVHVLAKVYVHKLRGMGIKVRDLVENITDHVESVDFTTLATSEGQLYDNKEEIRRAFIIHKNDTECEAVGICNKTEECASSLENNYTAHSCNLHQPGCSIECGPNGACIHSGGISYCSCDFDWLNIYYGERCDRVAVSLEAELGITFGCLGAVLIFVFVGCLIRSRNKNKESYCEDEAGDWRGFSGTDSRWLTFSGRYSTREIPYKRSLRDGRHLVPAHDPFGSSRMTRPGLYLPGNAGTDTSFVNNVTSYSKFSSDVDFSIRRPHVSKEPSAVYLSDQSWRSTGYTNSVFYNYPEERTHL